VKAGEPIAGSTKHQTSRSGHGPSFLRWAGSKRKSLATLAVGYKDPELEYIEPFAGSAALFFSLAPRQGVLSDLNGHLVNALRNVRDHPHALHNELIKIDRNPTSYYEAREEFNSLPRVGLRSAVLFVYLNRNCFNGLWRTNLAGRFNVPFGGHEMGAYPPIELFLKCSALLKPISIRHQDFRKTLKLAGRRSYIYADPPYFSANDRVFIEYGRRSFSQTDLDDLIAYLKAAEERGARIALTYDAATELPQTPTHWRQTKFEVTRNVGG